MNWWEERKHILVREKTRLDEKYQNNDFKFEVRGNQLWLYGTILKSFEFELRYPPSYPSGIPDIFPKNRSSKWVPEHQFVKEGRFCLDIREKTWCSRLTAADIISSLEALLIAQGIKLIRKDKNLIIYEEPEPTIFEKTSRYIKYVLPKDIEFPKDKSYGLFRYDYKFTSNTYRCLITGISEGKDEIKSELIKTIWEKDTIVTKFNGLWIRVDKKVQKLILLHDNPEKLIEYLKTIEIIPKDISLAEYSSKDTYLNILAINNDNKDQIFCVECSFEKNAIEKWGVYSVDLSDLTDRIPNKGQYEYLKEKKVTIIGCGSGGSKDAEYLVKSGLGKIVLIDDDILKSENILRHACQLPDLSIEKVYAVEDRLKKINPEVEINTIRKNLDVIDKETDKLIQDSDLIIVETAAQEELFNEYAFSKGISAIYAKVYPMGFGGEIIRTIPGVTPCFECSHYFKEAIVQESKPDFQFPEFETISYDTLSSGEHIPVPALAVDSDFISLICVKMAIEVLHQNDFDNFNDVSHIRLWGNKKEWIFDKPFQCFDIPNKNVKSIKNCIVCFGEKIIEEELSVTHEQIDDEFTEIINRIKIVGNGAKDDKN